MKTYIHKLFLLCAILTLIATTTVAVDAMAWSRYEIIMERKPFGEPPPPPQPVVAPQPPVPQVDLTKQLKLVAITKARYGTKVGVIDLKDKKEYYLYVGEIQGDFKVMAADIEARRAFVKKGFHEAWLAMSEGNTQGRESFPVQSGPSLSMTPHTAMPRQPQGNRTVVQSPVVQPRVKKQPAVEPKFTPEELENHLRKYNMDCIRAGLPALPIPLSKEEDAQLVSEGVLPPGP